MKYSIEQKIQTLVQNAVMDRAEPAMFVIENVEFSHWEFNFAQGWLQDSWLARSEVQAGNYQDAFKAFCSSMQRLIPRISLIGQCYIDYVFQPFLILKPGADVAFFRFTKDVDAVGLMFMEKEYKALELLCRKNDILEEFYYYWNDVVNAIGYTPKLLLMFSALEALSKPAGGKKDFKKLEAILGKDLVAELYKPNDGLRHRLAHGEYFSAADPGKNYVHIIHGKIMAYFNQSIFGEPLLDAGTVEPQRHFFGNKEAVSSFIRGKVVDAKLALKDVIADFERNGIHRLEKYEPVFDEKLESTY